jgi:hypothetical protein
MINDILLLEIGYYYPHNQNFVNDNLKKGRLTTEVNGR